MSLYKLLIPAAILLPGTPEAATCKAAAVSINHLLGIHPWGAPKGLEQYIGRKPDDQVDGALWIYLNNGT